MPGRRSAQGPRFPPTARFYRAGDVDAGGMAGGDRRGCADQLDPDSLNVHFAYDDDDAHVRHQVWFLDAVTVLNQMRAARALGIETFALWRLGQEDNSLWKIWDKPLYVRSGEGTGAGGARARTWIPKATATSCASRASRRTAIAPSRWTTTIQSRSVPFHDRGDDELVSALLHGGAIRLSPQEGCAQLRRRPRSRRGRRRSSTF